MHHARYFNYFTIFDISLQMLKEASFAKLVLAVKIEKLTERLLLVATVTHL